MKILATVPNGSHAAPNYILDMSANELCYILVASGSYESIEVTDADNINKSRPIKELLPGDLINTDDLHDLSQNIIELRNARKEVKKASATLKAALTRLGNAIPDTDPTP